MSRKRWNEDTQYKLSRCLRHRLYLALKRRLVGKKVSAVKDLGCPLEEFIKYLESKWLPGMSWKNYGRGKNKWNIDHIIPISCFDLTDIDAQKTAVHYTNLQPLWEVDNNRKRDKLEFLL